MGSTCVLRERKKAFSLRGLHALPRAFSERLFDWKPDWQYQIGIIGIGATCIFLLVTSWYLFIMARQEPRNQWYTTPCLKLISFVVFMIIWLTFLFWKENELKPLLLESAWIPFMQQKAHLFLKKIFQQNRRVTGSAILHSSADFSFGAFWFNREAFEAIMRLQLNTIGAVCPFDGLLLNSCAKKLITKFGYWEMKKL